MSGNTKPNYPNPDYARECAAIEQHEFESEMMAHIKSQKGVYCGCDYCATYGENLHDMEEQPLRETPPENIGYTDLF